MARVAIEFDDRQIFLAAMHTVSRKTQIKCLTCLQHEDTEEAAISALTAEVAKAGLAKSEVVAVVCRSDVELRLLDVPPAPENELPAMVKFVAKNEFASMNESWVLDFVRLSGDAKEPGKVLAAGLIPEVKTRVEKIVEASGMRLKQIVFRPLAAANYLSSQLAGDDLRVLVEHGQNNAHISLFNGPSMFATRTIRLVGDDLAKTYEREIKRTIGVAHVAADKLTEILLVGEKETVTRLGGSLSKSLSKPHRVIDPAANRSYGQDLRSVEKNHRYIPLIGTFAYQQAKAIPSMDFLNPRKVEVQKSDFSKWYLGAAVALAVLLLMFFYGYWQLSRQSNQIADRTERLNKIRNLNEGGTARPAVDVTKKKVGEIDDWVCAGINWQDTLLEYSKHALTPEDAIVDNMIASQKGSVQLTIKARIKNEETEGELVTELQKNSEFITTQKGSKPLGERDEFKIETKLEIGLNRNRQQLLQEVDKRAETFLSELRAARISAAQANTASN